MKIAYVLLATIPFCACSHIKVVNNKIYEAQLKALGQSPYKSAKGAARYVEAQKKFRSKKLPELLRKKMKEITASKDTLWMSEVFDETCINCVSYQIKVLDKDTIYSLRQEADEHRNLVFKTQIEPFKLISKDNDYELRNSELIEIVGRMRHKEIWNTNQLQYGADNCNDGDHTLLTVVYPGMQIEVIYVRCWMPFLYRNRSNY